MHVVCDDQLKRKALPDHYAEALRKLMPVHQAHEGRNCPSGLSCVSQCNFRIVHDPTELPVVMFRDVQHILEQLLRKTAEVTSNVRAGNRIVQSLAHHRQHSMEIFGQVLFLTKHAPVVGTENRSIARQFASVRPSPLRY